MLKYKVRVKKFKNAVQNSEHWPTRNINDFSILKKITFEASLNKKLL